MNILMINQHASNHGDEAAGKAFLRQLRKYTAESTIGVLYNTEINYDYEHINIDGSIVEHKYYRLSLFEKLLVISTFLIPFFLIKSLYRYSKTLNKEYKLLQISDLIINAPGGVNIGPYKDWRYLWRLYVSIKLNKSVFIYSISFGPLSSNYIFKKISLFILKNANFLSLRDKRSQRSADELKISYQESIDTAFLDNQPKVKIPHEITNLLKEKYVIVVPNELYRWHPLYKNVLVEDLDNVYLEVMDFFNSKKIQIVLLPQMYGTENDSKYFSRLKAKSKSDNIVIIPDNYSVDIQQQIVEKAQFLVGARYHTIIFSINNNKPFLSLAYEHKMTNTLETVGLLENNLELKEILGKKGVISEKLKSIYQNKLNVIENTKQAKEHANKIATKTFLKFLEVSNINNEQ